jgi:Zn-dependent protease
MIAMSGLLGLFGNFDLQTFLIRILVLCISLSFHEMAHAWAAYRLGDDTAALQGRLSLNPLVHLDPIGSIAFIIGGIGWARPVPINPARFDRKYTLKKGIVLTSVAGPLSNLILATGSAFLYYVVLTIGAATASSGAIITILSDLLIMLYGANVILAVFNLLPIPPLDGFKVFGAALPNAIYYRLMSYERYIGMVFLFIVLFFRGVLATILPVIAWPFNQVIQKPLEWLFTWLWRWLGLIGS